jgi:hypothetical protein
MVEQWSALVDELLLALALDELLMGTVEKLS